MPFRYIIVYLVITSFLSCSNDTKNSINAGSNSQAVVLSAGSSEADRSFNAFIEKFSKDTSFQLGRIRFPLSVKQYDTDSETDTIIYQQRSVYEMLDFRKDKSEGPYDQWKQKMVVNERQDKATIEVRGIENGIAVDYHFEKGKGKWMLVGIVDSST